MAKANRIPAVTKVVTPEVVTLTLSRDEADVLTVIMARIGGMPTTSVRGYADNIQRALEDVGFRWEDQLDDPRFKTHDEMGTIVFEDYPVETKQWYPNPS